MTKGIRAAARLVRSPTRGKRHESVETQEEGVSETSPLLQNQYAYRHSQRNLSNLECRMAPQMERKKKTPKAYRNDTQRALQQMQDTPFSRPQAHRPSGEGSSMSRRGRQGNVGEEEADDDDISIRRTSTQVEEDEKAEIRNRWNDTLRNL